MPDFFLFALIILLASILQTSTGFGFSIMATPFLLLLFAPQDAIQINLVLSLFISAALIRNIKNDVNWDIFKRLLVGSIVGLPFGIWIFLSIEVAALKISVGILILILTLLLMFNFRIRMKNGRDTLVGGLSGLFTTSIGMPGPPLLLYFSGASMKKEMLRATTLAFYLFIYSASLLIQVVFAGTTMKAWTSIGVALPIVGVGLYLGQILFNYVSQKTFRVFTYIILIFTGVYLLIGQ
ncbi:sulfite exporter TauE/SafE family protein [Pseudogracilibacillus auburnensis]|uniref:sulfite exporter TauE/SafE family protein n=1 Tax=Pseudogracilibacillus auburnensis TaxID=1494959 RepID=UPI001A974EF4|nr:sulfite exporter TauE/SafE family protein [Pseudogracilibacillus auburnensis]MBO1003950.1 sulfite exporter TauE/SafE family protein [Pseudogracilibacillus auburnensis]